MGASDDLTRRWLWGRVKVAGNSMAPRYRNGDWLLVRWGNSSKVGSVLLIEREVRPGVFIIKRLLRIDSGKFWVEGDNAAASTDSQQWGAIGADEIIGRVLFCIYRVR